MSKLADLIRSATHPASTPLGFGSARAKSAPSMLMFAVIDSKWKDRAAEAATAGADAVLLARDPNESDITAVAEAAGDRPCGVIANDTSRSGDAGFVVLGKDAPASHLQVDNLSCLLQIDEDLSDIQLRTIESLPVEAVYLDAPAAPLTIGRQMELQRITGLTRKPLLAYPAADAGRDDLLALRDAGVLLLAVDMEASNATQTLQHLREVIDTLPAQRGRRRGEKADVTLPTMSRSQHDHDDEDDDDD